MNWSKIGFLALAWLYAGTLMAQVVPGSVDIVDTPKWKQIKYDKDSVGELSWRPDHNSGDSCMVVTTFVQPDFIHNLSVRIPLKKGRIKAANAIALLSFEAKTVKASLETGEARCLWILNRSEDPKDKLFHTVSLGAEWKTYYIPLELGPEADPQKLMLTLQFGFPPQEFWLKNIHLHLYPPGTEISSLPRTRVTYPGMEPDAPWRKLAAERIEQHRKGNFQVRFMHKGQPLSSAKVQIELRRHHFGWGAAINSKDMLENGAHFDHFSRLFNLAVFENDLKIKPWTKADRHKEVIDCIKLLRDNKIDVKGHVLIWPGFKYLPESFSKNQNNPKKIEQIQQQHLKSILSATKGLISHWDVVNEAYTNTDLQRITGSEAILYRGFFGLKKSDSTALRYVNEYGIISKGGLDKKKQQWYYDFVQRIDKNTGGLVDGIGMQSHIGTDLTPPEKVYEILEFYAPLQKQLAISEFTMDIDDPQVREQYTRDFITVAFSHPAVHEFLFWGYQSDKSDIYTEKWEYGAMGRAFFDLVHRQWITKEQLTTDASGQARFIGFYATYKYTVVLGQEVVEGTFDAFPGSTNQVIEITVEK